MSSKISVKIHESYRKVVSVCDLELIGKYFEDGNRQVDVKQSFYEGKEMEKEKVIKFLKNQAQDDATFNIVGKESINAALQAKIIHESCVAKVDGIPFALSLL